MTTVLHKRAELPDPHRCPNFDDEFLVFRREFENADVLWVVFAGKSEYVEARRPNDITPDRKSECVHVGRLEEDYVV